MKKAKKIIAITLCSVIGFIVVAYLAIGLFGTFDMASSCAGGYRKLIYDREIDEMKEVVPGELDEDDLGQLKYNLSFDGRNCQTEYTDKNGETVKLTGKLRWFWNESIKWQVEE